MHKRLTVLLPLLAAAFVSSALAQDAGTAGQPLKPALPAQAVKDQAPKAYGTSTSSYYRIGSSEFTPIGTGFDPYSDTYYDNDGVTFRRHGTNGFNGGFLGTPHLPSGARVLTVFVNGCVASAGTLYGAVYSCNYYGDACTALAEYHGVQGCGSDAIDVSSAGYVVDNSRSGNELVIRLNNVHTDGTDSFSGVIIEYELQVSPAPATPTFNDVPTTDFGFQFIEALVKSGITGGTGGGNYSPDAYVTRRQMAIFLAKALGLQFN